MIKIMAALLGAILLFSGAAQAAPAAPGRLEFTILRNGAPSGRHIVEVTRQGDQLRAVSRVEIDVRVGPLTLYTYRQSCVEMWSGDVLASLSCTTRNGGRNSELTASAEPSGLLMRAKEGVSRLPKEAVPTNWWAASNLDRTPLFSVETGRITPLRVTRMGVGAIEVEGQRVSAERVRVEGTLAADLWYDSQGRWIGCSFAAHGQNFEYRLESPRAAAPYRV